MAASTCALEDVRLDLADEGGIAQQQAMGAEDGGLVLADLLGDALDDGVEFLAGRGAGASKRLISPDRAAASR